MCEMNDFHRTSRDNSLWRACVRRDGSLGDNKTAIPSRSFKGRCDLETSVGESGALGSRGQVPSVYTPHHGGVRLV